LIQLDYEAPPADLSPYITAYYHFRTDEVEIEDFERADIAQFRVRLEGSGSVFFGDGHFDSFHDVSVMGPRTKASRVRINGPAAVFGVGLLPAGWAAFTGLPADKHINRIINGRDLIAAGSGPSLQRLREAGSFKEMVAYSNEVARAFYESAQMLPHWFIRAVDEWLESRLSPDIADLEATTGLSRRQIERLSRQFYGSPPKTLVRKYRALRTANAIAGGKGDWQDFIDEAYYDQSHCIREIKEFTGITPNAIRTHVSRLTALTWDRSMLFDRIIPYSVLT
jgi:AraC-like DNA-binding protein